MKPLQENYQKFVLFCICPPTETTSNWMKLIHASLSIFCIFVESFTTIASFIFVAKYFSTDLANALCACYQIAAGFIAIYSFIIAYIMRDDFKETFNAFQAIYDANKHKDSSNYMAKANQQGEHVAKLFVKYFLVLCPLSVLINCIGSIIYNKLKYGYIDPSKLYHACRFSFPWDQNTLSGWMAEEILSVLVVVAYLIIVPAILTLFISICQYHGAFYKVFRLQIGYIMNKTTHFRSLQIIRIKELLHESISFHVSAKELFYKTADTYSPFILIQLIGSMVFLANCTFEMDLAIHNLNLDVSAMVFGTTISILTLYIYCYFGKFTTDCYTSFGDCLYKSNWTILSVQLQKYYILMIAYAQKPIYYHGCGLVEVNLETFLKIIKTVFTYYMMFKTLTTDH